MVTISDDDVVHGAVIKSGSTYTEARDAIYKEYLIMTLIVDAKV